MTDPIKIEEVNEYCKWCRCENTSHTPDSVEPELFYCSFCRGACGRTSLFPKFLAEKFKFEEGEPFGREPDEKFNDQFDYKYQFGI